MDELNCPVTGATSMTAIVIDATDPISEITMSNLANEFRREVGAVEKGGYIRIVSLTGTPGDLPTLFDGCNPGDGSTVDSWTNNPTRRQRKWEDTFGEPLRKLPEDIDRGAGAAQSPILAAIQKMRAELFDSDIAVSGSKKKIVIVSDMIEHTDLYSQYRSGSDFDAFRASDGYRNYRTTLDGIDVRILYVERAARKMRSVEHITFWEQVISESGGNLLPVKRLEGLN